MYLKGFVLKCLVYFLFINIVDAKQILINRVSCLLKSNKLKNLSCYVENGYALAIHATTDREEVNSVIGITEIALTQNGLPKILRVENIRLNICELLNIKLGRSILHELYKGIRMAAVNFPRKCPFKANTTYSLKNMGFDMNSLPEYLPEYNFTFKSKAFLNEKETIFINVTGGFCNNNKNCTRF